jgi:hypothetical protein
MMQITKTINPLTGDLNIWDEIHIDFENKTISLGATFLEGESFSCEATFQEVLEGYTTQQKQALIAFFKRAKRIAINNGVIPDTDLTDNDIDVILE